MLRILGERRIRASGKLIREGIEVVSFTELSPWDLSELVRWRSHLVRWSFEPYAVCVRRDLAEPIGIAPVLYLPPHEFSALPPNRRFLYQKHAPPKCDWTSEKEWRLRGDLDLSALPRDAVLVLTATEREAEQVREAFGLRAASFDALDIGWPARRKKGGAERG